MDSENDVILVDENVSTNGLNGHSEDLGEMKTRSKTSEADVVKSKVRCARNVGGQDKAGSDTEKKDKKVAESKPPTKEVTASAKPLVQDKTPAGVNVAKKSATKVIDEQPVVLLAAKKRNADREDDSGINSRASSVSNDDATPRMRTRSSRSSEIASTSTPTKKGQGRMPLSTYDFDDMTFDDEVLSPGSLKRKAVLIVEEMDEMDEEKQTDGEPAAKRPALMVGSSFFNVFLNPLRALRGKFTFKSRQPASVSDTSAAKETSPPSGEGSEAAAMDTVDIASKEKENVSQPETTSEEDSESTNLSQTCRIM